MKTILRFLSRRLERADSDFDEEIQAHLEIEADRLVEDEGMSRREAMAAARRQFGNVTRSRERFYESNRVISYEIFTRNLKQAIRSSLKAPASTVIIVGSLALGIGFNTAILSLADHILLRALPVHEPEGLVHLEWQGRFVGTGMGSVGYGNLLPYLLQKELGEQTDVFESVFARATADANLAMDGPPSPATVEMVTGTYFPALGVQPALGRLFGPSDEGSPGSDSLVVLSHDYWRNVLGADEAILGKRLLVNNHPMTVVGVAEHGFRGIEWAVAPAIWVPVTMKEYVTPSWGGLAERRARFLHVFARLKPDIDIERAEAGIQPWFKAYLQADTEREGWPSLAQQQMEEYLDSSLHVLPAARGQNFMSERLEQPLTILAFATSLMLLLACLNVANLSLARLLAQRRTIALKTALGATKLRLVGEQLVESALLAGCGGVLGVAFAPRLVRVMLQFLPSQRVSGLGLDPTVDGRILVLSLGIGVLATLVSGVAPAAVAASVPAVHALKVQARSIAAGLSGRRGLVVSQVALALVLLIGAGLFGRTLSSLRAQGPGFPTSNLFMFRLDPLLDGYEEATTKALFRRTSRELEALPDIDRVGLSRWQILRRGGWGNPVTIESSRREATDRAIRMNAVSPDFFETLGASVISGRGFLPSDARDDSAWRLRTAVINEAFAHRYFPDTNPLGSRLGIGSRPDTVADIEIVGIVSDFHSDDLRTADPQVFFSLWELDVDAATFYVRSQSSGDSAAASIRAALRRIDPSLTVLSLRTVDDQLDRLLRSERMLSTLAAVFGAIASLLAVVGLYGVLVFSAGQRTKEIGIRLALGAPRWSARGLILAEALRMAMLGLAIAVIPTWIMGRLIANQLFAVGPADPLTFVTAAAMLVAVCLIAALLASRKAGAVNPLVALRLD